MEKIQSYGLAIRKFLASNTFLYIIVGFFVFQATWLALSFRFPMIYDEGTHLSFIRMYSDQWLPYTTETPGNMMTQVSLFHYLSSFIYRGLILIMNESGVVIVLRLLCIAMVAVSLVVYSKILRGIGVPKAATNVTLLLFVLLPITPLVAATINYDNMLFLITALYMLIAVKIIKSADIDFTEISILFILGFTATLTKYSFLPIFGASLAFLAVLMFRRHGRGFIKKLQKSFISTNQRKRITIVSGLAVVGTLFAIVYIGNLLVYQSIKPSCFDTRPRDVCLQNGVIRRNTNAIATADTRIPVPIPNFVYSIWFNNMIQTTNWTGNSTTDNKVEFRSGLPFMNLILFTGTVLGIAILLYMWRSLGVKDETRFAVAMVAVLFIAVFIINFKGYYTVHVAQGNQPRYLLSLLPILIGLVVWATSALLGKYYLLKISVLAAVLLVFTQGGGTITHILRSETSWYWPNGTIKDINTETKDFIEPYVNE